MLTCKIDQLILQSANCTVSRVAFMTQVQIEGWASNIQQIELSKKRNICGVQQWFCLVACSLPLAQGSACLLVYL